jgi:hypothetical protein
MTCHCEPVGRGNLVFQGIASSSQKAGTPRNDNLINTFVLIH